MKRGRIPAAHLDENRIHTLHDHLFQTAKMAKNFAQPFRLDEWAYLAALWHDLGKYSEKFQKKIYEDPTIQVDHSTAGAQYAFHYFEKRESPFIGLVLAWLIAGHHAGLADYSRAESGRSSLQERLKKRVESYDKAPKKILEFPSDLPQVPISDGPLWLRMLFSALVDADFLDTERFFDERRTKLRSGYPDIETLLERFSTHMQKLLAEAPDTPVNRERRKIYETCVAKADAKPGIYTLCVPTGGGKTLSSMAFALHHAKIHGKQRIIYVIPYTSIIEQNAAVYKKIFGDAVIEHHSQFDTDDTDERYSRSKLAAENWDAPIIVTTTVQFFESLFANRPSRCRKLHNIVQSVVVIDEVQTLPPHLLDPILRKIETLEKEYGVTFVLSTATQPDFHGFDLPEFSLKGLPIDGEIVDDPVALARRFRRTEIKWHHETPISIGTLAQELASQPESLLCVVNTRDRARDLYEAMENDGENAKLHHLSANMCGKHRFGVIEKIKKELAEGERVKVVSTNLIEAGVDLDFPRLYRELAGLESIAQAAGRCNREGRLPRPGLASVFTLDLPTPRYLSAPINALHAILPDLDDPLTPEAFRRYFAALYREYGERLDGKKIVELESRTMKWPFAKIAERFRMIEDGYTQSVVIPLDETAEKAIALLQLPDAPYRRALRRLQRYSVNLPKTTVVKLLESEDLKEIVEGVIVLENMTLYRKDIGFDERRAGMLDAESAIF